MNRFIEVSFNRSRTVLMLFFLILGSGLVSYLTIPRESSPDIPIPVIYVSVSYEGISPEDSERLLVFPLEKELRGLEGIKELTATASQSHASVTIEFESDINLEQALADVRDKVNLAKSKLPDGTDEPVIKQITLASEEPVITAILSGNLPERALVSIARELKDALEAQKQILEVDIAGDREEVVDVIIDPLKLESYGLVPADVINLVSNNNKLVAAGQMDNGAGSYAIKVPAVYKTAADILGQPVKVDGDRVVTFADIAEVRSTFKEGGGYARLDGKSSIALEIKKRPGENIIETITLARHIIDEGMKLAPETLSVDYVGDQSRDVRMMVTDLQNNVLSAVILVVIVIIGALGSRSALLVGIAIPGSFLSGILILGIMGLTINMVVLFSLIMAVGMLVDGAIVVTEYADRRMSEGISRRQAYQESSRKMAWPIIASTATTLAAFFPLMFWPGMMGEFMKFLPLTLIATLSSSLVMALVFIPTIGALIGRPRTLKKSEQQAMEALEQGDWGKVRGLVSGYVKVLKVAIQHPFKVLAGATSVVALIYTVYMNSGASVEYFPDVDMDTVIVTVKVESGNLSVDEKDQVLKKIEQRLMDLEGMNSLYARTGEDQVVGTLRVNLIDWQHRATTAEISEVIAKRLTDFAGLDIAVERMKDGPPVNKPLELIVSASNLETLYTTTDSVRKILEQQGSFINIEDDGRSGGYEWRMQINRENAARYGADVASAGGLIQMVTSGLTVGSYRPDNSNEEVDIRIRLPEQDRHLESIDQLRLMTSAGLVPISQFSERQVAPKVDSIHRLDGKRTVTITADLTDDAVFAEELPILKEQLSEAGFPSDISFQFKGEEEDQQESQAFLMKAFGVAIFVMAIILVTQFNSFYQSGLILSAVILSTGGVFLGLIVTGQNFGIVMSGIGVIALAGIVVNNNIVLIDTFNQLKKEGLSTADAVVRTGAQRLRPVLLTTVTTVLGLLPMVLSININLFTHSIEIGAPFTQMWTQLATAIAGGLTFATMLTLIVTPCLLVISGRWR